MSELAKFSALKSLHDVATYLGYKPSRVSYLIRVLPPSFRYTQFTIPKKSGGHRTISAPRPELKQLQKRLADKLQDCLQEVEQLRGVKQPVAHGFKRNYSIMTNGFMHRRRKSVFNLDLSNFFDGLNFGRVRGFFIKNVNFKLDPVAATVIAQIACFNNGLPQGSPCSPVISNLIANSLDMRLKALARREGCSYTRYADDLTFSSSRIPFPKAVAVPSTHDSNIWEPGPALAALIGKENFQINPSKTRMQYCMSRQEVTGLIVNKRLNTRANYRRESRAMVHRLRMTGSFELPNSSPAVGTTAKSTPRLSRLEGRLAHAIAVDRAWIRLAKLKSTEDLSSNEKLLRDLIFYRDFASSGLPTIMVEGKTDTTYLKCAIKRLASVFPSLVPGAGTTAALKFLAFNKNANRLFGINGGTGDFKKFLENYHKLYRSVRATKGTNPVLLVLDNDSGATPVLNFIKNYFKVALTPGAQSIHVVDNLHIVLTSPIGSPYSCIEDMFDASTLATTLGGKKFNKSNAINTATEYGKAIFAEAVIKKNQASIDFTGFSPLLTEVAVILNAHRLKVAALTAATKKAAPLSTP